ncbi:hypothetical protein [Providencia rettgeri]|uniref:hypothetical protein n=1 Tax=Providencia rettgeri TaxID=587 RepID=UPI0024AABF78
MNRILAVMTAATLITFPLFSTAQSDLNSGSQISSPSGVVNFWGRIYEVPCDAKIDTKTLKPAFDCSGRADKDWVVPGFIIKSRFDWVDISTNVGVLTVEYQ